MTAETNELMQKKDCCGGPAPREMDACCREDADAKASGKKGCGCNDHTSTRSNQNANSRCCN